MTQNEWIIMLLVVTNLVWFVVTNYWERKAKYAQAEAAAYFTLLEAQKNLVNDVLALNETVIAERNELYRQQQQEFITRTGVGIVH